MPNKVFDLHWQIKGGPFKLAWQHTEVPWVANLAAFT